MKIISFIIALTVSTTVFAAKQQGYVQHNLVANNAKYKADTLEPKLINAWGIAIRPAGAGGHFWITAKDNSFEYVGDVQKSPTPKLKKLHADELKVISLPVGGDESFATSTVFNDSKEHFIITQQIKDAEPITAPAKFLFASDGGIISAWTERKKADGTFDRAPDALTVIDNSATGAAYFGLAISKNYDRLYAAYFGKQPGIRVFDGSFKPLNITFDQPFDENKNGKVDAGEYAPFNIQALTTPAGEAHIFVAYAKSQACTKEGLEKKQCAEGELFAGEEDTSKPGQGRVAEFTEDGKLVAVYKDAGHLSAPWGLVFAPKEFGPLSGKLLVSNFGSGTIAAFDPETHAFVDTLRNPKGKTIKIDKIWGLLFGNGESLGDANALYFTAGPDDEKDGIFGSLRVAK
jgi:uncharacterized protein (TIGR03118 family)